MDAADAGRQATAAAAFRIAAQLVDEQLITLDEALQRVTGEQLARLLFPQFDRSAARTLLATGLAASPGAAVGAAVFDPAAAVARRAAGDSVVPCAGRRLTAGCGAGRSAQDG